MYTNMLVVHFLVIQQTAFYKYIYSGLEFELSKQSQLWLCSSGSQY